MIPLPTIPQELRDFKNSISLTTDLRRILEEPTMKRAITALKLAAVPTSVPPVTPGLHPDTSTAHVWHTCMGMNAVFQQLERMAVPPGEVHPEDALVESEFEHLIPDNLRTKPIITP